MSKSEDEDQMELPHELKKLEINSPSNAHLLQQSSSSQLISKNLLVDNGSGSGLLLNNDTNIPVSLNPFFYQIKFHETTNNEKCIKAIFGTNFNISSCEYNDNNKEIRTGINNGYAIGEDNSMKQSNYEASKHHHESIQHSLLSQTKFKSKSRNINKKSILKESILKVLQYSHVKHKSESDIDNNIETPPNLDKLNIIEETSIANNNLISIESILQDPNNSNSKLINKKKLNFNSSSNEFLDFRNLIEECNLISYTNNNNNNNNNNTNLNLNIHKINNDLTTKNITKPFTTIQKRNRNLNQKKLLRKSYLNLTLESENSDNTKLIENEVEPKSSCSQQARINISTDSAASCDITIDELASYFETFVHIPKKMSEMAEMMYI